MTEIPAEILKVALDESKFFAEWLHRGNSKGSLSEHAIEGLSDSIARALLAERESHQQAHDVVADIVELGRLPSARARSKWIIIPAAVFHRATAIRNLSEKVK